MGYDLKPKNRASEYGRYNIAGWSWLYNKLEQWNVPVSLPGFNNGEYIPKADCLKIADAYEAHMSEIIAENPDNEQWAKNDMLFWKNCGGCWVY